MIDGAAEAAENSEARPGMGDARVDLQAAIGGADAQDVLRRGLVRPGGRPRKPAVARQPELRMFVTQDILRINVWFALVFVDRVVLARRVDLAVVLLSLIHISEPTRLGMISYAVFCLKKKK